MFYKIIENKLHRCPENGILNNGTAVSNLPKYFALNPDIAAENGYYRLSGDTSDMNVNEGVKIQYYIADGFINIKEKEETSGGN